jgi:hypothetical protein
MYLDLGPSALGFDLDLDLELRFGFGFGGGRFGYDLVL